MSLIKNFLQGKWLGHPLHPALVHVPTGLFPAALLFDLMWLAGGGDEVFARCAFWAIAVGLIGAVAAAPTGLADWWDVKPGKPAYKLGLIHMVINVVVLALMALSLYLRWRRGSPWTPAAGAIAMNVLANLLLVVSGYLGGRMVFDKGVGVARLSKKKWAKIARAGHARLPVE
jgi:uncharacterized membrane protein